MRLLWLFLDLNFPKFNNRRFLHGLQSNAADHEPPFLIRVIGCGFVVDFDNDAVSLGNRIHGKPLAGTNMRFVDADDGRPGAGKKTASFGHVRGGAIINLSFIQLASRSSQAADDPTENEFRPP